MYASTNTLGLASFLLDEHLSNGKVLDDAGVYLSILTGFVVAEMKARRPQGLVEASTRSWSGPLGVDGSERGD